MQDSIPYRRVDGFGFPKGTTVIGEYACSEWDELTSVIIPEGVTAISRGSICTLCLAHIQNLSAVTFIGDSANYVEKNGKLYVIPKPEKKNPFISLGAIVGAVLKRRDREK